MSDGLHVRGGAGGVSANVADLRTTSGRGRAIAERLSEVPGRLLRLPADGAVLRTTPLSPVTAARVGESAASAVAGLQVTLLAVRARATALQLTAQALEAADRGVQLRQAGRDALDGGAGLYLGLAGTIPAGLAGGVWGGLQLLPEVVTAGRERGLAGALATAAQSPDRIAGGATDAASRWWIRLLLESPTLTDTTISGLVAARSTGTGQALSYQGLVGDLVAFGAGRGWFDDGADITLTPSTDTMRDRGHLLPRGISDLFALQTDLMDQVRHDPDRSRLRVIEVAGPDGPAYILQVPGTQEWDVTPAGSPSDLVTNLHLTASGEAALHQAMTDALIAAGVGPDDPVMVVGHSQGGIAAATYAGSEHQPFSVTHVVTGGSPIAYAGIPDEVQVLALEHDTDLVPRLDARGNPDAPNWTTVTAPGGGVSEHGGALMAPHGSGRYAETGQLVDASDDPSLRTFLDGAAPFLAPPDAGLDGGTVWEFDLERDLP